MNKSQIPKGNYCYDDETGINCPYWREDKTIKADFYGFGYQESVWCDYLKVNSATLDFEGIYEKNGSKCYTGHKLNDQCKICDTHRDTVNKAERKQNRRIISRTSK